MIAARLEEKPKIALYQPMMIRDTGAYSARNSSKGALIEESSRMFSALASGLDIEEVREQALRGDLLSQRSSLNRKRIWISLKQRYLTPEHPWITSALVESSREGSQSSTFISMLYLLYALRDHLTFDFVTSIIWSKGHQGSPAIARNDVLDVLRSKASVQPQIDRWSESTRNKLSTSVLTALRDFGLLAGSQKKRVLRPHLPLSTSLLLLRILVAEGCRGREILQDRTWRLFLLNESEVAQCLAKIAMEGFIRFEKVGSTVVLETPADWEGK